MKRSEMLEKLEKHIKACGDFPDDAARARYILGELEQAGMRPPQTFDDYAKENGFPLQIWEPEDD